MVLYSVSRLAATAWHRAEPEAAPAAPATRAAKRASATSSACTPEALGALGALLLALLLLLLLLLLLSTSAAGTSLLCPLHTTAPVAASTTTAPTL